MWLANSKNKARVLIVMASTSAFLISCGSADPVGNVPGAADPAVPVIANVSGCTAGLYSIGGSGCFPATSFAHACALARGVLTHARDNASLTVCQQNLPGNPVSFSGNGIFFRLLPNDAANSFPYNTGYTLRRLDKLSMQATGGWGTSSAKYKEYLGGAFVVTTWTTKCDLFDVDGLYTGDSAGAFVQNQVYYVTPSQPSGLYGSDGTEAFLIGSNKTHYVNNDGQLRFGFNVPWDFGTCANAVVSNLRVARCTDGTGAPQACP